MKTKKKAHWSRKLRLLGACSDAVAWAKTQPSLAVAWTRCENGSWMLWLAGRVAGPPMSDSRRPLTLAACACARLALIYLPVDEKRPLACIELAERWARGESVTRQELVAAGEEAWKVWDAHTFATAHAYAAAAYAAVAAHATAYATDATAADYADYAATAAAATDAAARVTTLKRCAELVREHYQKPPRMTKEMARA